jgi:ribonuclease HI
MHLPAVYTINIDGAARGNPGPAAYAYVISADGKPPIEESGRLGDATNNVAEYTALVRALERATQLHAARLLIRSDSELLVKQMNGEYRVKNPHLQSLYEEANRLRSRFDLVSFTHVRREQNRRADELCNEALDGGKKPRREAARPASARKAADLQEKVRDEALLCLRAAANSWKHGDAHAPSAEQVWEQLWSILEEGGVLRTSRR